MDGKKPAAGRRPRLAFIDPGLRKAAYFLALRGPLAPHVEALYWSQRPVVRSFMRSARVAMHPRDPAPARQEYEISDSELRRAIGAKELALRPGKALRKARRLLTLLAGFIDGEGIDAILVWNGSNLRGALAIYLARQRRLPVIFAEHGYLPGTTQLDLQGVNFNSSVTACAELGTAHTPAEAALDAELDAAIARFKTGQRRRDVQPRPPAELQRNLAAGLISRAALWIERGLVPYLNSRSVPTTRVHALPGRAVLLPFQVRKDSQLVLHSPLYGSDMEAVVRELDEALLRIDPALRLIAKFHPYELPHVQRAYHDLPRKYPRVSFVSAIPMAQLLERVEAVVTVNSTTGFEALLYDKPVLALGRNFYTAPGIVQVLRRREDLESALRTTLRDKPDSERRRAFLRFVQARLLVAGAYNDFSERSLSRFASRIVGLLAGTTRHAVTRPGVTEVPEFELVLPAG